MGRDIFEIRGNISDVIFRIEEAARIQEEREKEEREAKWARDKEERDRKEAEWKRLHPVLDRFTYISSWNYDTYCWQGDYCNVHFYEFSDINREPRKFPYTTAFFRFLDDCGIMPTQEDVNKFKHQSGCHIVCKPNSKELIVGNNYDDMARQFCAYRSLSHILSVVPEVER